MKRFKNILFVHSDVQNAASQENSMQVEAALSRAVALARDNRANLTLIKITEQMTDVDLAFPADTAQDIKQAILEDYRKMLEDLVEPYRGTFDIQTKVLEGRPFLAVIHEVLRNGHDLVVKCADGGETLSSRLFSTTDMHLMRKCPCPVLLLKPDQGDVIKRVVAAVDLGEQGDEEQYRSLNKQILEMAISFAHRQDAELHVVHAWKAIAEHALHTSRSGLPEEKVEAYVAEVKASHEFRLSNLLERARDWVGHEMFDTVKPQIHAIKGLAENIIETQVKTLDADILVMGTVGRTGIPGFIGNTAETVLNRIECSVLAIKPAAFVSPVELPEKSAK